MAENQIPDDVWVIEFRHRENGEWYMWLQSRFLEEVLADAGSFQAGTYDGTYDRMRITSPEKSL